MDNDLLYRALADNTRRRLIRLLLSGSCCVSALAARLNISESAVSQHVGLLRRAGLLDGTRRGRFMHYAVNRQRLLDLARELEALAATHPDDKADEAAPRPSGCDEAMRRRCHGAGKLRTLPMAPPTVEEH